MLSKQDLEDRQSEIRKLIGSAELKGEQRKQALKELEDIKKLLEIGSNLSWDNNASELIEKILIDYTSKLEVLDNDIEDKIFNDIDNDKPKYQEYKSELLRIEQDLLYHMTESEKLQKKKIKIQKKINKEEKDKLEVIKEFTIENIRHEKFFADQLRVISGFIKKPIVEVTKETNQDVKPLTDKDYMFYKLLVAKNGKRKAKAEIKRLGYDVSSL